MTHRKVQPPLTQESVSNWTQISSGDRWQIYFRLQELNITCQCRGYQPLKVDVSTAQDVVQVWSVTRHCSKSRSELAQWLNHCLTLK